MDKPDFLADAQKVCAAIKGFGHEADDSCHAIAAYGRAQFNRGDWGLRKFVSGLADEVRDFEPLEWSQHGDICPLADESFGYPSTEESITEEMVLEKCECSMKPFVKILRMDRALKGKP